jgi:membrane fusion protein, heavy metal efflux system
MKKTLPKMLILPTVVWLLVATTLFSCSKKAEKESSEIESTTQIVVLDSAQEKNAGIVLDTLHPIEMDEEIKANGIVDVPPQHLASVSVPMTGYIDNSSALSGQHIHKGDFLATLHHPAYIDLQQDLARESSKLVFIEEEFLRQKEMLAGEVTAKRDFQQSESNYNSQKAVVRALEEKVKLLGLSPERVKRGEISSTIQVVSPINGYIKSSSASIGKYSTPEIVLFEIVDISHMHLELKVFEKDASKLVKGQKVVFYQPGMENKKMEGVVWLIGKNLDLASRTIGVHIHFDERQAPSILPGMYVSASIETTKRQVLAVPEKSVFKTGQNNYLFCLRNKSEKGNNYEKTQVGLGNSANGWIEIQNTESLKGKQIVVEGAYYLNAELVKPKD